MSFRSNYKLNFNDDDNKRYKPGWFIGRKLYKCYIPSFIIGAMVGTVVYYTTLYALINNGIKTITFSFKRDKLN